MQVVILAGGLATRLGAVTRDTPKSLVMVAERPFLAWQLERLRESGFSDVLLCIGHLGAAIRAFAGDGSAFGLSIRYSEDGLRPRGTAGALRNALHALAPEFLVTYGDSYLPFDYGAPLRDLVAHPTASGTMAVHENRGRFDASNTAIRDDLVLRYEKGVDDPALDHIDYGATALRHAVIAELEPEIPIGLEAVQQQLAKIGKLRAFRTSERFYEIGSLGGLSSLDALLRRPRAR
jgi:NDP-sugar pyrophosphorylase family protein